ncbi:hypothetical protein CRUP_021001, partial [Coryphaenoides rupestris]
MQAGDGDPLRCLRGGGEAERRRPGRRARRVIRRAAVRAGRNEFRELILRIEDGKAAPQRLRADGLPPLHPSSPATASAPCGCRCARPTASRCSSPTARRTASASSLRTLGIKHPGVAERQAPTDGRSSKACLPRSFDTISRCGRRTCSRQRAEGPGPGGPAPTPTHTHTAVKANPSKKPVLTLPVARKLNKEQAAVLTAVLSGKNVFFTGSAGTGKSFLLKRIVGSLPPKSTYATASTGVAACHIAGTTLHNFAGAAPLEQCIELAQRPGVSAALDLLPPPDHRRGVHGGCALLFDKLEAVARSVRRSTEPFGGIQLIICGDFLQLPPVSKGKEKALFCFQARSWRKVIQVNMELTEVRRQTDQAFISLLQAVRVGRVSEDVTARLMASAYHKIERDGILATRLCTHKDDVELTNDNKLQQLPGSVHVFEATDSDPSLVKTIDAQSPVNRILQLKVGAQVMLTKNLEVQRGLVNGARGVVVGFEPGKPGLPRVRFLCGATEVLNRERWMFKSGGGLYLSRQQLPLKLAWAISIHKSQGMTLDCVEISLARVFESGQAYVALSRAKTLEGLRVMDFDPRVVRGRPR